MPNSETNPLEELGKISHLLPLAVLDDINRRIGDWLSSGGKETDPYIDQQLKYAQKVLSKYDIDFK